MKRVSGQTLVYCGGKPFYRRSAEGLMLWCRGHHNERLVEWAEMQIPIEVLKKLLTDSETKEINTAI